MVSLSWLIATGNYCSSWRILSKLILASARAPSAASNWALKSSTNFCLPATSSWAAILSAITLDNNSSF